MFCAKSYVMSAKDKQSTFTCREQRLGVWILPHLVTGIFDRGCRQPASTTGGEDAAAGPAAAEPPAPPSDGLPGDNEAATPGAEGAVDDSALSQDVSRAGVLLRSLWRDEGGREEEEVPAVDEEDEDPGAAGRGSGGKQHANARFDWSAYREAFPGTPPHAAITAMFAEYAVLVGRITRHLGETVASPMTIVEGEAISKQAQEIVLCYAVPILGPLHTTKVHKLLAHLLEAMRFHGNIMNGDTSKNEQQHKEDKHHYARTNKSAAGFLRQLVRHAQESRAVLQRNRAAAAAASAAAAAAKGANEDLDCESDGNEADDDEPGLPVPDANATLADTATARAAAPLEVVVPLSAKSPRSAQSRPRECAARLLRTSVRRRRPIWLRCRDWQASAVCSGWYLPTV